VSVLKIRGAAQLVEHHRIPLLYVYSDADEFVDSSLNVEFMELFGARHSESMGVRDTRVWPTNSGQKAGNLLYF